MGGNIGKGITGQRWPFSKKKEARECTVESWAAQVITTAGKFELYNLQEEKKLASSLGYPQSKRVWRPSLTAELEEVGIISAAGAKSKGKERYENIIQAALKPHRIFLQVMGTVPYIYDEELMEYRLRWCSRGGIHTLLTALYMSILMISTAVGVITMARSSETFKENTNHQAVKLTGVILLSECLVNAWAQCLNIIYAGKRFCKYLNTWNAFAVAAELDPIRGIRIQVIWQIFFVCVFSIAMFVMTIIGHPKIAILVIDGVAEGMLMVPQEWLKQSPFVLQFIRVMTCLVCLHIFAIFKGSLFSFTTSCHMLKNGFASWNTQLTNALEDIWRRRGRSRGRLGLLVQSHYHLVKMVRETEAIFSPMLQCYYASTVVILCTELYLLACRMGTKEYAADGVITTGLMTIQTTVVFLQVSLAAAAVEEVAQDSTDILRRGIPFDASERDKFNKDELTTALTGSPVNISGGKYFTINRPFIITVLSAVITYFIVMIQFMHSADKFESQLESNDTVDTNLTSI